MRRYNKGSVSAKSQMTGAVKSVELTASFDTSTGGYVVTVALPDIRIGSATLSVVGPCMKPSKCVYYVFITSVYAHAFNSIDFPVTSH